MSPSWQRDPQSGLEAVREIIREKCGRSPASVDDNRLVDAALEVARQLQQRASQLQTPQERRQQAELDRMLQHPEDKATLTQLTDQGFRSSSPRRAVDQMVHILDVQGVPRFFSTLDQALLKGFQSFGEFLPGVAVPLVKEKMRKETANVILPAEHDQLLEHLRERAREGIRMNVNFLGEAILGEREAHRRLNRYFAALQLPEVECVSIKISTLYSQISALAREHTIAVVAQRLESLFRTALAHPSIGPDGRTVPKFVYLDMEEYRDLHLTAAIFQRVLSQPGLERARAGIALQAYIPDSFQVQQSLTAWAVERHQAGAEPITIRLVKGANMEMERVEASLKGWPQAPYRSKLDTDANYKRMLRFGMRSEHLEAVHLGIASHNLFDLAYGVVLAVAGQALDRVQFEMLEGMANHQRRALFERTGRVLLYAPACLREEFIHAIGYLVRRLDENTGPDNFLRHAFRIQADSPAWRRLETGFRDSVARIDSVPDQPQRTQDRRMPSPPSPAPTAWRSLVNEPDTDFSLPANSAWAEMIVRTWIDRCDAGASVVPVVVGGVEQPGEGRAYLSPDPSRPGVTAARYAACSERQLQAALRCATADPAGWQRLTAEDRYRVLRAVAQELRNSRADLIGTAMADAGKTILESDPEVSEAIDFVEFYARCALELSADRRVASRPAGPTVVISPWNFPIAIPCGGIAAALAAGNPVILKPASDTVLPAFRLCQCFWKAGVPSEALQFAPCEGALAGAVLLRMPAIARVILTGGTETALRLLEQCPALPLLAETGGKNATMVSGLSDRDLAIKNVLHSAFSHSGQKCSATSLLLLEREIYECREFQEQLIDAATSLRVGSAWDLSTRIGPLIRPPTGDLARGLNQLEPGESWLVRPSQRLENPCLYSPGIKWNVAPGSFTHLTELFGPVLGVMPYDHLDDAIEMVHATGYGLTSGLESLDDREQQHWRRKLRAGNLYINRPTTGAIVLRQPFGGLGKSVFGPGAKAGGPNYVTRLVELADQPIDECQLGSESPQLPALAALKRQLEARGSQAVGLRFSPGEENRLLRALVTYDRFAREEILAEHDHVRLLGQDNLRRYLPVSPVRIRLHPDDSDWETLARCAAAVSVGCRTAVSFDESIAPRLIDVLEDLTIEWGGQLEFIAESDEELREAIREGRAPRIRYAAPNRVPGIIRHSANECFVHIADSPVLGSFPELLCYVAEQSVSVDYHRYGNLGTRAAQEQTSP